MSASNVAASWSRDSGGEAARGQIVSANITAEAATARKIFFICVRSPIRAPAPIAILRRVRAASYHERVERGLLRGRLWLRRGGGRAAACCLPRAIADDCVDTAAGAL